MFCLYQGLNREPSDPEADEIPMCYPASSKQIRDINKQAAIKTRTWQV